MNAGGFYIGNLLLLCYNYHNLSGRKKEEK